MDLRFVTCATVPAPKGLLLPGASWRKCRIPVRYGILLHPELGPVLIDAGYGPALYQHPASLLLRIYRSILGPTLIPGRTPTEALAALGYPPSAVRHIVLTHLHADHICHLGDFPGATIHVHGSAITALANQSPTSLRHDGVFPELLPADFQDRITAFPERQTETIFGPAWDILGDGSVMALSLPGHAAGHIGLWFPDLAEPLLYATDTSWTLEGLVRGGERPLAVRFASKSYRQAIDSVRRVAAWRASGYRVALCHDPSPIPEDFAPEAVLS